MGDGRYYTAGQFTQTFIIMVILMWVTVDLVATIYRQITTEKSKQLISIYALLYLSLILRFLEEVMLYSRLLNAIVYIRQTSAVIVVLLIGVFLFHLLVGSGVSNQQTFGNFLATREEIVLMGRVFLIMCLGMLLVLVFLNAPWADYVYLAFNGFMAYLLHRMISFFAPYSISHSMFTKTKDMILDYVFIVDVKGNLIYQNNHSELDRYFFRLKKIKLEAIETMFNQPVRRQKLNGKEYIKYTDVVTVTDTYFSYNLKPLVSKGEKVGGILTFTDVSGLIQLIENLNREQADSELVNKELKQYAEIVYRLEKEREVHLLLDGIAQNQEISMLKLKDEMLNLQSFEGQGYKTHIREMIDMAKDNLADVRRAVSTFRAYYGGHDD